MLRYLTSGESHGYGMLAILEGLPAGLPLTVQDINRELKRRQQGFGRGKRMQIEHDTVRILSGLKKGVTLGSPLSLLVENRDFSIERLPLITSPRPGHADLAGVLKYGFNDARCVLERASARSTVSLVAVGAAARVLLAEFGIGLSSAPVSIGGETDKARMRAKIRQAIDRRDTVGGILEVRIEGVPAGLGTYAHPDRRLDARLCQGVMSIPGIKGVEIGLGFGYAERFGSEVHDEIAHTKGRFVRSSNNAGGIEGGMSNGETIVVRACMKPIATLLQPLRSADIRTGKPVRATVERSDICVVEAAGVVAEAACALVIADAFLEKFGSDTMADIRAAVKGYRKRIRL